MLTLRAETARELMTPGPYSLADTDTVEQAAAFLTDRGFGAAVVIDEAGHPVGVVTRTDLLIHARERGGNGGQNPLRGGLTEGGFSAPQAAPAPSGVGPMGALNIHHLFFLDTD